MQAQKKDVFVFRLTPETRKGLELLSREVKRSKGDTLRVLIRSAVQPLLEKEAQSNDVGGVDDKRTN